MGIVSRFFVEGKIQGGKIMLLGVTNWSFSFAWGMRKQLKPSKPMTSYDLIEKVQQYKLEGAQVGLYDIPPLGTSEFEIFKEKVHELGLFWVVSAGLVSEEAEVLNVLDYATALGCKVVRAALENFGIQFTFRPKYKSLDDYVSDSISHLKNIMPRVEKRGLILCLENHGGLRMKYLRRVFETIKSKHLGVCFDTGNAVLTLEDPLKVAKELAARIYMVHLKDWNLIKTSSGILARGCSLGEGVVNLPGIVEILKQDTPCPDELYVNIEAPQEYIPLNIFTSEFWKYHKEVTGDELGNILSLIEKRDADTMTDYRLACMRGASEMEILDEEECAIRESVCYALKVLQL